MGFQDKDHRFCVRIDKGCVQLHDMWVFEFCMDVKLSYYLMLSKLVGDI